MSMRAARGWVVVEMLVLVLVALAGAAGFVASRSPAARAVLLKKVSSVVESRYGVAFAAEDFRWEPDPGRLVLEGVRLGVVKAPPALTVPRVAVELRLKALMSAEPSLRALELDRPRLDLSAPFPELGGAGEKAEERGGVSLAIRRLTVRQARVVGLPAPAGAAGWLDSWTVRELDIEGSWIAGRIEARVDRSSIALVGGELGDRRVSLAGKIAGPAAGPWSFDEVVVRMAGLSAEGRGRLGTSDADPLEGDIRLAAEPARLLPGRGLGGRVGAEGRVDLRRAVGRLHLRVEDLPGEAVEALLASRPDIGLPLPDTLLGLGAELELGPGSFEKLNGRLTLDWTRGGRRLLALLARPAPGEADGLRVPIEVDLLPDSPGRRRVEAVLAGTGLAALADGRWEEGRIDIAVAGVEALLRQVDELWPGLVGAAERRLDAAPPGLRGPLRVVGGFRGALADPEATLQGSLSTAGGAVTLRAAGRPAQLSGEVSVAARELDLEALGWAGLSGRLTGTARVAHGPSTPSALSVRLAARDLGLPGQDPLESAEVEAELKGARVHLRALRVARRGLEISGSAVASLAQPLALPVEGATADLLVSHPDLGRTPVPLRVGLRQGTVSLDAAWGEGEAAPLRARGELPLGLLGERLSGIVAAPASGPARVSWELAEKDWSGLLVLPGEPPALEGLRFGSRGSIELDPRRPAASSGEVRVTGLGLRAAGVDLSAADLGIVMEASRLRLEPAVVDLGGGELRVEAEAEVRDEWTFGSPWADALGGIRLTAAGRLPAALAPGAAVAEGSLDLDLRIGGTVRQPEVSLAAAGPGASWIFPAEPPLRLSEPKLELELRQDLLTLHTLEGGLDGVELAVAGRIERRGEVLRVRLDPLVAGDCRGRLAGDIPLAAVPGLRAQPQGEPPGETVDLEWRFAACDWTPLLSRAAAAEQLARVEGSLSGRATLDLRAPAAGSATIEVGELEGVLGGRRFGSASGLRITLGESRLDLAPARLESDGQSFTVEGFADLDPAWEPRGGVGGLVRDLGISGRGALPASVLNPVLGGGRAAGDLELELRLSGPPQGLTGTVRARGPDVSMLFASPYRTRLEAPELAVELGDGRVAIEEGRLRLNEGEVQLRGGFEPGGEVDLTVVFSGVRYRLDYGLLTTLNGFLTWRGRPAGDSTLSGKVRVARGMLTRPIELDRDFLREILVPIDLTGTEGGPLERVALDLEVSTREGVRIRNNLADMLVVWSPLKVTGSLQLPLVQGTLEAQPGGVVFAPGQTLHIQRAAITYPGRPGEAPEVDFSTSTTADEESISRAAKRDPLGPEASAGEDPVAKLGALSEGLAVYYGDQVASRVGSALGGTEISFRPIPVFGETDPSARLNISRDFSPIVAVVASIDLRAAEARTYVLDLHDLPRLPRLRTQLFTLDGGEEGASIQQAFELGGGTGDPSAPRIRRLVIEGRPPGVSKRGLKRALGLEKGDRLEEGGRFAAEVEIAEYLLGRGYPSAGVTVDAEVSDKRGGGVDLAVSIDPGPRTVYRFEGDVPPRRLRGSITSLYRADFWEEASLTEMEAQTVRVFRSRGYLQPEVRVEAGPAHGEGAGRLVVIRTEAGRRIEPEAPVFEGLEPDEAAFVSRRFWGPVQRTELAVGLPDADRRVLAAMADLGYPQGEILARRISEDGRRLTVELAPGPRRRVANVTVEGFESPLAPPSLAVGDPPRVDWIAAGAAGLRSELLAMGHAEARVRARLEPHSEDPMAVTVHYEIEPGIRYRFAASRFSGLRATREKWARSVARLPIGETYLEPRVEESRRRLYGTRLFSAVSSRVDRSENGDTDVLFDVDERSRYRLSYGVRWDSDDGGSVIVDATDLNFLGRGIELGLRALTAGDERSTRALIDFPRVFGTRGNLKWFNILRREVDEREEMLPDIVSDRFESTVQFGYPLSRLLQGRIYASWASTLVKEDPPPLRNPLRERIQSPLLGLQLLADTRGGTLLPERGLFASIDLSGSDDSIGSDFNYLRLYGQVNLFRPLARTAGRLWIWGQSLRVGFAEAFSGQSVRREDRFFVGGAFSVRGYPTEGLGPLSPTGTPRGGENLLVINQELRLRFDERFTALAFFDLGNTWIDRSDFGSDLFKSAGVGLRATTPIGLLRLDLASPLDRRPQDPSFKVHFGFGTVF